MADEDRYWIIDDRNESNKIQEAVDAVGLPLVGIVDEDCGGVIAYVVTDIADEFCDKLNGR